MQELHWIPRSAQQKWCSGMVQDFAGATVTLVRGVEIPRLVFWHDPRSSRRKSQVDPWRWNPENNVFVCFRVFKRLSSNEADPSMEMNRCRGL
eukprot:6339924-Pyramimonas_sp.AAC.1